MNFTYIALAPRVAPNSSAPLTSNNIHPHLHKAMFSVSSEDTTSWNRAGFELQTFWLFFLFFSPDPARPCDCVFHVSPSGTPVNRIPIMAKQVLDLYMLYRLVTEKGGLVEVINKKLWREITKGLNLPTSITSAAFTLRTQSVALPHALPLHPIGYYYYRLFLLHQHCKSQAACSI